jgi:arylsulfatase A-like enzyme
MWCKHTNFELDTHAPLLISAPDMKAKGQRTHALTEFVDIYPTLCDLAGLEKPKHLEGRSAAPLLDNPKKPWKEAAYSQYPRGKVMGYSVRTDGYRYTEWRIVGQKEVKSRELYDHKKDPAENVNVADAPENQRVVKKHSELLKKGFETIPR